MRRLRLAAAALACLALTTLLAACGGGGGKKVDAAVLVRASAATANAGTAHVTVIEHIDLGGQSLDIKADGVMDIRGRRTQLVMTPLSKGPAAASAAGTVIQDGLVTYMSLKSLRDQLRTSLNIDKQWAKIDLQRAGKAGGLDLSVTSGASDPAAQFELLRSVTGSVEEKGKDTVGGVATTHYHAVLDYDHYVEAAPPAKRAAARATVARLKQLTGQAEQPIDAWIDAQSHLRRMAFKQKVKTPSGPLAGKTFNLDLTMEFSDFGVPVHIVTPPAADTFDMTDLAAQGLRQAQP